jgi:alkylation response protein AidB-like acyl-CoA dehydrogenase
MKNFYTDFPECKHYLSHPLMQRIIELRERNFEEKDAYLYAPKDVEDALDNYQRVLEIVGEICADVIAPNANGVDAEGPTCADGKVAYASGTQQNLKACRQAGLMGMTMPRKYGGLNFPSTVYMMAADMISRADAGFVNIFALQDCASTIYEFGSDAQKDVFLSRVCQGETMSMDLTEPDAGSDLQSVQLKATYSEEDGCWYLNGVKRFITNGDSDIHLVLARSEEGTKDGRGLSMFIYDKQQGGVEVRRIEHKLGIKGSPTCELVYKNAKAELCGERRLGLIKYVMSLMNGARLGIAAQSAGISHAAYHEAKLYASQRKQFGKSIASMLPVADMVDGMKAKLDAMRALLYQTARYVDVYKTLEDIAKERKLLPEERAEQKKYSRMADAFTPLAKGLGSEMCNQNAYDALQVHGGSGFMKDYAVERLYRDARVTSIYEGTTQMQVVAAIRYVTTGFYTTVMQEYEALPVSPALQPLHAQLQACRVRYEQMVEKVNALQNTDAVEYLGRRLVESAGYIIMGYLLLQDATMNEEMFAKSAALFTMQVAAWVDGHAGYVERFDVAHLTLLTNNH